MCVGLGCCDVVVNAIVQMAAEEADKPYYHLCIVNLVIGTLYCAKVLPLSLPCSAFLCFTGLWARVPLPDAQLPVSSMVVLEALC